MSKSQHTLPARPVNPGWANFTPAIAGRIEAVTADNVLSLDNVKSLIEDAKQVVAERGQNGAWKLGEEVADLQNRISLGEVTFKDKAAEAAFVRLLKVADVFSEAD